MSAVHREFVESQAAPPAPAARRACHQLGVCSGRFGPGCTCRHDTRRLPPDGFHAEAGQVEGDDVTRRWPRTFDEAFKTPEWRNPVDGPYERPRLGADIVRWCVVVVVAVLLIGATL